MVDSDDGDLRVVHLQDLPLLCLGFYTGEFVAPLFMCFRGEKCTQIVSFTF